jgi:hypothetical protein
MCVSMCVGVWKVCENVCICKKCKSAFLCVCDKRICVRAKVCVCIREKYMKSVSVCVLTRRDRCVINVCMYV